MRTARSSNDLFRPYLSRTFHWWESILLSLLTVFAARDAVAAVYATAGIRSPESDHGYEIAFGVLQDIATFGPIVVWGIWQLRRWAQRVHVSARVASTLHLRVGDAFSPQEKSRGDGESRDSRPCASWWSQLLTASRPASPDPRAVGAGADPFSGLSGGLTGRSVRSEVGSADERDPLLSPHHRALVPVDMMEDLPCHRCHDIIPKGTAALCVLVWPSLRGALCLR